ncbi:MAG TPA: DUF1802 family protein [Gemmatimonadaceae bacterium]|nr:DUF1802 family protein [Gemmatimonadaceae bacterium]
MTATDTSSHLERTCLKEWAVLCDALAAGDVVAMVRKGGIREQRAGFSVRHDRFLLYPTYFHEKEGELQPRFRERLAASHVAQPAAGTVRLALVATVAGVWRVDELDALRGIEREHGLAWDAVASRFHYRDRPGVQVVAVRVARLPHPVTIPEARRYLGCVSWVALDRPVDVQEAVPVLDAASFAARLDGLQRALGAPAPQS